MRVTVEFSANALDWLQFWPEEPEDVEPDDPAVLAQIGRWVELAQQALIREGFVPRFCQNSAIPVPYWVISKIPDEDTWERVAGALDTALAEWQGSLD